MYFNLPSLFIPSKKNWKIKIRCGAKGKLVIMYFMCKWNCYIEE